MSTLASLSMLLQLPGMCIHTDRADFTITYYCSHSSHGCCGGGGSSSSSLCSNYPHRCHMGIVFSFLVSVCLFVYILK